MIVYLHGFRSSPASRKATLLRQRLRALGREDEYFCPALPASPRASIGLVTATLAGTRAASIALIGSSLGGYYATWIAE
ncbi:MAG: esterase, partial [Burkholderiaceae bacterium]|nr:esterase [Burkholderiaceae bacterium]